MFFTGIDTTGIDGEIETTSPIYIEVTFRGPLTGALRLLMDEETARCLGSTLTCIPPDEFTRERCIEAVEEMANMMCGCLLSHLEPDANLVLTTPTEVRDQSAMENGIRRWFCLAEGPLVAEFTLDPPAAGTPA